ncbi:SIR2 family NAD-dependent protein deacylase [Gracilimonas tropica]|uniref:SIR2 family NAD-dependent protein deacylase n=1 Tax=Gracilimonas tropica TaxID=454600 RepID=UPI00036364CD|nr:NAD-dependent deacylase [Gracilimonas tropica]
MPNAGSKKIAVITGAGISAESGLATFRDSGGLWEGYDIGQVATPEAWRKDPQTVLEFYNLRRKQASEAQPNSAHLALAELEHHFDVQIITQNVDDLHEKAGSKNVLHLHGELKKARSVKNQELIIDIGAKPIRMGDTAEDGGQLRPHVVWFGEMVPMIEPAAIQVSQADILVVIGTSLVVYPAAGLVEYAPAGIPKYIVDPSEPELMNWNDWVHIKEKAGVGAPKLKDLILKEHQING